MIYDYVENARDHYAKAGLPSEVSKLIDEQLSEGQSFLINWLESILENLPGLLASVGLMILSRSWLFIFSSIGRKSAKASSTGAGQKRGECAPAFCRRYDYIIQRYIQGNIIDALIVGY